MNEPAINVSPETPQSLREVGIYLGQIIKSAEERKQIEAKHHEENKSSIALVIKRIDDLRENYPTRTEFDKALSDSDKAHGDFEDRIRRNTTMINYGMAGLVLSQALLTLYLMYRH